MVKSSYESNPSSSEKNNSSVSRDKKGKKMLEHVINMLSPSEKGED